MALTKINQNNRLHQGTIDDEQIAKGFDVNPIIDRVNAISTAGAGGTAGAYSAGKFLITIYGI